MPIGIRVDGRMPVPQLPSGRRFFAANLWLCDGAGRQERGRPYPFGDMVVQNINRTMSGGGVLFIVGGLFSKQDLPTGFATSQVWLDPDFDISERLDLMRAIRSDISPVLVHGCSDDESFASYFEDRMRLRMITPILPLVIAGRETILAHSSACSALFPGIPIICGDPDPGPCQDRTIIDVSIDRNGLRPFSEEQVIEMLDPLRITVDIQ